MTALMYLLHCVMSNTHSIIVIRFLSGMRIQALRLLPRPSFARTSADFRRSRVSKLHRRVEEYPERRKTQQVGQGDRR